MRTRKCKSLKKGVASARRLYLQATVHGVFPFSPADSEHTLRFSELASVHPMIETYPLDWVGEAYAPIMSGDASANLHDS